MTAEERIKALEASGELDQLARRFREKRTRGELPTESREELEAKLAEVEHGLSRPLISSLRRTNLTDMKRRIKEKLAKLEENA